jgi:hypothetical protein
MLTSALCDRGIFHRVSLQLLQLNSLGLLLQGVQFLLTSIYIDRRDATNDFISFHPDQLSFSEILRR